MLSKECDETAFLQGRQYYLNAFFVNCKGNVLTYAVQVRFLETP